MIQAYNHFLVEYSSNLNISCRSCCYRRKSLSYAPRREEYTAAAFVSATVKTEE